MKTQSQDQPTSYNIRAALNKFFVESLSEKQHQFKILEDSHSHIQAFQKLQIKNGVAIHIKKHKIQGITLKSEQYFSQAVFFFSGFEEVFRPIFQNSEINLKNLISALKNLREVQIIGLMLDIPISILFLQLMQEES
ncbi:MAG: hypothetical protein D6805_07305 [Planctomycetota bacterium]|nr:MAG: hypothetical protein D6805_07305 [Planctomycetota bacterium]